MAETLRTSPEGITTNTTPRYDALDAERADFSAESPFPHSAIVPEIVPGAPIYPNSLKLSGMENGTVVEIRAIEPA